MWRASDPLGPYRVLVARHASLVGPRLSRLRQRVDEAVAELGRLERQNLDEQRAALGALGRRLADDARGLVESPELPAFLERLARARDAAGSLALAPLPGEPASFSLGRLPAPLSLSGCAEHDRAVCDDEGEHISRRATTTVRVGAVSVEIEVERARRYAGDDEVEIDLYAQFEEAYFLLLPALPGPAPGEGSELAAEAAALVLFALPMLGLRPRSARFTYP